MDKAVIPLKMRATATIYFAISLLFVCSICFAYLPRKPVVPSNLKYDNLTDSSVDISWTLTKDDSNFPKLVIQYKTIHETDWSDIVLTEAHSKYTLSNIRGGKTYVVQIYARNEYGTSKTTSTISFTLPGSCERNQIPNICASEAYQNDDQVQCIDDTTRTEELHGHWRIGYKSNNARCILSCDDGYIADGCPVHRKWTTNMPICIPYDAFQKAKFAAKVASLLLAAVGAGPVAVAAVPVVLSMLGFTSAGVAAGSLAAALQTSTTAAGSYFAIMQSIGASGLGILGTGFLGGTVSSVVGATEAFYYCLYGCESE